MVATAIIRIRIIGRLWTKYGNLSDWKGGLGGGDEGGLQMDLSQRIIPTPVPFPFPLREIVIHLRGRCNWGVCERENTAIN